jgi:hypothetical protein
MGYIQMLLTCQGRYGTGPCEEAQAFGGVFTRPLSLFFYSDQLYRP